MMISPNLSLDRHEIRALLGMAGRAQRNAPYFWGVKSCPKLVAKGLAEDVTVPGWTHAWRVTPLGIEVYEHVRRQIAGS